MNRSLRAAVLCLAGLAMAASHAVTSGSAPALATSVKDSPGYVPIVDPESSAVAIGRRLNAPVVRSPFTGGAPSLNELGRQVCRIFDRTPDLDTLMRLTISEQEFRDILWREFPQSRPATGLTWEDGWRVLHVRLLNGCNSALHEFGGRPCEFVRIEAASVATYKNFKLHNGITIVTRDAAGQEVRHNWLRSVAERKGRFKIYSVRD